MHFIPEPRGDKWSANTHGVRLVAGHASDRTAHHTKLGRSRLFPKNISSRATHCTRRRPAEHTHRLNVSIQVSIKGPFQDNMPVPATHAPRH